MGEAAGVGEAAGAGEVAGVGEAAGAVVASGVGVPPQEVNKQEEAIAKPVNTTANFFIGCLKKRENK
ncbi:hypothetical protein PL8927_50208 [Planktothrix serta PCC 8927]|uniref:Uncharacterized protein n=1 Tax=Planktothrix serta PCC 8927 TaxID=671068 RepID=A0A7Z9DYI5_9CYAN|nr:hypothetical protein PL8927_50208 [Planktothrix serta PCC 8927]